MGIEKFFNSLKKDFKIDNFTSKNKYNFDYILFDFNSIIHVISQKVNILLDELLFNLILEYHGIGKSKSDEYFKLLKIDNPNFALDNENDIYKQFSKLFNLNFLDSIIINHIKHFLIDFLKSFNSELIYISIDGVPTKAKIVEQKKRRFNGEFEKYMKLNILEKYSDKLKGDDNNPINKYKFIKNKVNWSRNTISPGTNFMKKLTIYLKSIEFKNEINKLFPKIDFNKLIVTSFDEKNEGEKKIMDFLDNLNNETDKKICIYSPDSDLILLSMILKNKNLKKYVLRMDQQKSKENYHYDLININDLENTMFNFIDSSTLSKDDVINDIVFIFTIFGDDFLHKIESYNVKYDIKLILEKYKLFGKRILKDENNLLKINYDNFIEFLKILVEQENEIIIRNFKNKYFKKHNYDNLSYYEQEIYKFENMIGQYENKLNKKYITPLGNPDFEFEKGKNMFYSDFFKDIDLELVIRMYIDGLQWVLDYYFNDITYHKWYYPFNKSPLLQDILLYINNINDKNLFENSIETLKKCCKVSETEFLSPVEHFFYITPFDKEGSQLKLLEPNEKFFQILTFIKNSEFNNLYPDIKNISLKVFNDKDNDQIDCRTSLYLNKCFLKVLLDSNLVDEIKFKNKLREIISVEEQIDFTKNNNKVYIDKLYDDYKNIKSLYMSTGDIKYKNEFKRIKHFIKHYL